MSLLVNATLNFWDSLMIGAKVTIDGVVHDYVTHETSYIQGNVLKKFVKLDTETGHITHAFIYDRQGRPIQSKTMDIKKGEHGTMIVFLFEIEIKED